MSRTLQNFFGCLPMGSRLLLLSFALVFPLAMASHHSRLFELYPWGTLCSEPVREGQVWRLFTYAFLPMGIVDWLVSLFWLTTLVCVVGRVWTGPELWLYCLLSSVTAGLIITVMKTPSTCGIGGNGAMIFALLAAWSRFYGRERIILLGIGEMSVRQAAWMVALVEFLILFFTMGWWVTAAMLGGGLVASLYLFVRGKNALNQRARLAASERIARLEL